MSDILFQNFHKQYQYSTLLYKKVSFFCLKFKISITTEPIEVTILAIPYIGPSWFKAILRQFTSLFMPLQIQSS